MNCSLSKSEVEVCNYLKSGMQNKTIADKLCVCEKTVKFHLSNIFKKLSVKNRTEACLKLNQIDFQFNDFTELEPIIYKEVEVPVSEYLPAKNNPMPIQETKKTMSQVQKVEFVDEKFGISDTMNHMRFLMKEVTKEKVDAGTVNAACNCIARMNETINTSMQAARFLNER